MKVVDKKAVERYNELCAFIRSNTGIAMNESAKEKKERIEDLKKDFKKFTTYYFPHYCESETPFFHLRVAKKIRKNKYYKGWLKWARGHAKSVLTCVEVTLWLWANDDILFTVIIGQNDDKAAILLGDLQAEFENNQRLINDFGQQKTLGSWTDGFFVTKNNFIAKSLGLGMDPRGLRVGPRRPDYIVCDDWETRETAKNPRRQDELADWLLTGVIPAMDNKNRRVVLAQNHWAPRMIFSKIIEENPSWDVDEVKGFDPVTYAPTWKEKYPANFFSEITMKEMGLLKMLAEYNNEPHVEGKLFLDKYFQYDKLPQLKSFKTIIGRWDVAYGGTGTSDFNAIRIWGLKDGKKWLIDCFVQQSTVKPALIWIHDFQKRLPIGVHVQIGFESQFWNTEITRTIEEVENEFKCHLNLIKIDRRTGNKYDHMITMLPQYQNGRVIFNQALKPLGDFQVGLQQIKGLEPNYKTKDDAPDADVYAFDELDKWQEAPKKSSRMSHTESRKF